MAFILRRPFTIANTLKHAVPQQTPQVTFRSFQTQAPVKQAFTHASSPLQPLQKRAQQNAFHQAFRSQGKRSYQSAVPQNPLAQGNLTQRLVYGGAIFGAWRSSSKRAEWQG